MNEIFKRYKRWFTDKFILIVMLMYIMICGMQYGHFEGEIVGMITVLSASIIFPPLSIFIDFILLKLKK